MRILLSLHFLKQQQILRTRATDSFIVIVYNVAVTTDRMESIKNLTISRRKTMGRTEAQYDFIATPSSRLHPS